MMIHRQALAECPVRCNHPSCRRNRCANISERNVRWCSIAHTVIQRQQQLHPHSSLSDSICMHLIMMIHRQAPAECPIRCKHPAAPETDALVFLRRLHIDKHRSYCNSAAAAPALTQLSATQHLLASDHDDTSPRSCRVSRTLQSSQLSPKQMRNYFWAQRGTSIQIAQAMIQRPRHQHSRSSLCDTAVAARTRV